MTERYYADEGTITYREAHLLVEVYLTCLDPSKATLTTVDLLRDVGLTNSHHNRLRIHAALSEKCEPIGCSGNKRTRFRVPAEVRV